MEDVDTNKKASDIDEKLKIENVILKWFEETCFEPKVPGLGFDHPVEQVISIEDVTKFLALKKIHQRVYKYPTYAEIMKEAEKLGVDGNGLLNKEQTRCMLIKWIKEPNIQHELQLAFEVFDTENRGFLELEEIQVIITTFGEYFTPEEVREFLRDANITGNGCVHYRQFIACMFRVAPEMKDIRVEYLYTDPDRDPSVPLPTPPPTPPPTPKPPTSLPPPAPIAEEKKEAKRKK